METAGYLDWLSITMPAEFQREVLEAYVGKFKLVGSGSHGYSERWQSRMGVTLLAGGAREQGQSVSFPGHALEALRDVLGADKPLLGLARAHKGKATRVDLALNLFQAQVTVADFVAEAKRGNIITKTRSFLAMDRVEHESHAVYIGSRTSDRFLRIYDKALERGIDNLAWLRLELQCRRLVARSYVERMAEMQDIRPFINRAIDEFASFPTLAEYREAVAQDDADVPLQTKTAPAFWRWMATQVVPSMVTRQIEYPEEEVLLQVTRLFIKQQAERGRGVKPADPLLDNE